MITPCQLTPRKHLMNWSQRAPSGVPPDKGSFPLDHFGECKVKMEVFMSCLKENKYSQRACRVQSKDYIECRMNHELMTKESLHDLGFSDVAGSAKGESLSRGGESVT